jgi:TolB-like protein
MADTNKDWSQAEVKVIKEQLARILESSVFKQADRLSRFLEYIVEASLSGRSKKLNQYLIGLEVFDRDETFDPAVDSTVRVEAGRLRAKLREYYTEIGQNDPILIELPKGGYAVKIQTKITTTQPDEPKTGWSSVGQKITPVTLLFGAIVIGIYLVNFSSWNTHKNIEIGSQNIMAARGKPTIAILPFDNMSDDPEQEYFSDGITEDIITDLSKISGLFVIARHSTFIYKGKQININEISKQLGVRYVLEGSVRKAGDRLRITAQLIDAHTNSHLWAERYDRELKDIFDIQDDVSRKIVDALEVKLSALEAKRLGHKGTDNIAAYEALLRGQEQFYSFTVGGINSAIDAFSRSIELDQSYAEAYAWKSRALVYSYITGINNSREERLFPAMSLAKRAIELDKFLPIAHANLGWAKRWNKEFDEAIVEVTKAIELDSNFADGYLWLSMILSSSGRGQEALDPIEKGIRINPNYSVTYLFALGRAHYMVGKYEEALIYFKRGIDRNPNFIPNHIYKIAAFDLLGNNDKSEAAKNDLISIKPDYKTSAVYQFYLNERLNSTMLNEEHKADIDTVND